MDSRVVNKAIKQVVHPVLKEHGFTQFTSRNSWRYRAQRIDVINFQSFNAYLAESVGCTTYSFAVNIGCFLKYIPVTHPIRTRSDQLIPQEYECPLRMTLHKGLTQRRLKRPDIWLIKGERDVEPCVADARDQILNRALPVLDRLADDREVLRIFREDLPCIDGGLWGFGNQPSPVRSFYTAYTARHCSERELAREELANAIQSGCFDGIQPQMQADLEDL